jgi:quinoprotein glucose dehydrogenase
VITVLLLLAADWTAYGGDAGGTRYSTATQIDTSNVDRLQAVWTYKTRSVHKVRRGRAPALETTPLYVNGALYVTSAVGRVASLDPATGKEHWSFDPKVNIDGGFGDFTNRGVAWHPGGTILAVSVDARLFALDALTGKKKWEVNLREGLRIPPKEFEEYEQTSPPCVIGDVVVVGSAVADNGRTDMPSGEVRGFDVATGRLLWTWDPAPGTRTGGANAWSVIVADAARELVFVPTGSASPDYYGGMRKERNHANSVVALQAKTGRMVWAFQTVHHDLWDYDVASPPALVRVKDRDAVAVGSKTGHLFFLDRETGKPLHAVEERPVPKSDAEGEETSPTQPFPVVTPALTPHKVTIRPECKDRLTGLRNEGVFTPPSERGSLVVPGNIGGLHWGGVAYDPALRLVVAPSNNLPAIVRLIRRDKFVEARKNAKPGVEVTAQSGTPYGMAREFLLGADGQLCHEAPYGLLSAVDVDTGELRWQIDLGAINLGGPITTVTGLTFIGATVDGLFRAFETKTGKKLWSTKLPAGARATPMTYVHQGRQYVVIAAGGHGERFGPPGDDIIAFALPE